MKDSKWKYAAICLLKYAQVAKGNLSLKVYPTHTVSVKVQDSSGSPLAKAKIFFGADWQGYSHLAYTDASGVARFPDVFHGNKPTVDVQLDGYYFAAESLSLPAVGSAKWSDMVTVTLEDARSAQKGKVVDEQGAPVPGIRVWTPFGLETTTDDKGEFTLPNMPDREVPVIAENNLCSGSAKASKSTGVITIKVR
jgi:hypothetical protein